MATRPGRVCAMALCRMIAVGYALRAQSGLTSVKEFPTFNPADKKFAGKEVGQGSFMVLKTSFNSLQLCSSFCILCQKSSQFVTAKKI